MAAPMSRPSVSPTDAKRRGLGFGTSSNEVVFGVQLPVDAGYRNRNREKRLLAYDVSAV